MLDAGDTVIREFAYNDQLPWPTSPDGDGPSLVLVAPDSNPEHGDPFNWRPSAGDGGTPGTEDTSGFTGVAGTDLDGDGLDALIEYALGASDGDPSDGFDRLSAQLPSGEFGLSYTLDNRANDAKAVVELSDRPRNVDHQSHGAEFRRPCRQRGRHGDPQLDRRQSRRAHIHALESHALNDRNESTP